MSSLRSLPHLALAAAMAVALAVPAALPAQSFADSLKKKAEEAAKRKIEQRTERRAGEATDAALDRAECAVPGTKCEAGEAGEVSNGAAAKSARMKPGEGAWKNYDFVPGERVIFAEDFTGTDVGDFPKRLRFESGNMEIVEWNGARYLSTNTMGSRFSIPLPETLPERFTLELDYSATEGNAMTISFADPSAGGQHTRVEMFTGLGGLRGSGLDAIGKPSGDQYKYKNVVFPVRIMADGNHVKVYMGDTRVANVPNASLGRAKAIWFELPGWEDRAAMIGNIRVAAGGRDLYDEIAGKGRVATQGIFFDTGSDRIRPESTPTLKEIGAMLNEHADLRLTIEGHTDNVGDAKANLALSEKRAAAVKEHLVEEYGIDAARLEAKGLGASKPSAPNSTAEGRQQNRRVELVKM